MLYYRVKPQFDGLMFRHYGMTLVANELFTPKEYHQYACPDVRNMRIQPHWVEPVILPESRVYQLMGARFEYGRDWNYKEVC